MLLNKNRLFPTDKDTRAIAKRLFGEIENLPILSPHGHTDPEWFSKNQNFTDPSQLLIVPDHYIFRMLMSQGVNPADLGIADVEGNISQTDGRKIWQIFAQNYHLFRSTPTRLWLDYTFQNLFGFTERLTSKNADQYYDKIADDLTKNNFKPQALFDQFNIEVLSTTEGALDTLEHHQAIKDNAQQGGWAGRVVTSYRPDLITDPDSPNFKQNIQKLGEITGEDIVTWQGYLAAHRNRRAFFKSLGATTTDHGHPTARTVDLSPEKAAQLYEVVILGKASKDEKEVFRAQMLTEMAGMSIEDGLVMQLHCGSHRSHHQGIFSKFGVNMGTDIPQRVNYVTSLKPLLDKYGFNPKLTLIIFTLDETTYSRELAPMAGVYSSLKLGPAWWFYDAPAGMMRYREQVTETAGFYNTVGFNDDTRAFPSIPARHDVARRVDCSYLADQVARHLLDEDEAVELAYDLTYGLAKKAYKL